MHCPSERTCTTASLFASAPCRTYPTSVSGIRPGRAGTDPRLFRLEAGNVLRLQTLGSFADLELNRLPFVKGFVSVHLDSRKMDEDILTGLALDESVAFAGVEPLHCSLFFHFLTTSHSKAICASRTDRRAS